MADTEIFQQDQNKQPLPHDNEAEQAIFLHFNTILTGFIPKNMHPE